jgi:hypothetical protein
MRSVLPARQVVCARSGQSVALAGMQRPPWLDAQEGDTDPASTNSPAEDLGQDGEHTQATARCMALDVDVGAAGGPASLGKDVTSPLGQPRLA